jgi:hypothetical protein
LRCAACFTRWRIRPEVFSVAESWSPTGVAKASRREPHGHLIHARRGPAHSSTSPSCRTCCRAAAEKRGVTILQPHTSRQSAQCPLRPHFQKYRRDAPSVVMGQTRHLAPPKTGWDASAWSLRDTERRLRRSVPTLGKPRRCGSRIERRGRPVADTSPTCASPLSRSAIVYGGIQRGLKKAPGKALQMEAMSGAPSQLLRCGSVPQLRKLVVNEARAFLVPEFSASEHCRGCSTAGTISGRTLYQIVDVEDGTRSPHRPRCTSGSVLVMSKEKPCDQAPRGFFFLH